MDGRGKSLVSIHWFPSLKQDDMATPVEVSLCFLVPMSPGVYQGGRGSGAGWAGITTLCSLLQGNLWPDAARCAHAHPAAEPADTTGMTAIWRRGEDAVPAWAVLPSCWSHSLPRTWEAPALPQHSRILVDLFLPKRLLVKILPYEE